jgi:AraC-like DNA-binding protein
VTDPSHVRFLREELRRRATQAGPSASPYPNLIYFRADAPFCEISESPGILVAVVADGAKTVELASGRRIRYAPGSYLFLTRETRYTAQVEEATPERPYLSLALVIDPELLTRMILTIDDCDAEGEDEDGWVAPIDDAVGDCFVRLLRSVEDPLEREVIAPLIEREIVFRLLRTPHAGPLRRAARSDDTRIRDAMRYIRAHLTERLTVEALARRVAMSPSHFAHRFREVARMTPMRFVKNARLGEARLRMLRDGLSTSEAAAQVGYESASHFSRDFKSHYGAAPAAYAREMRARLGS